MRPVQFVEYLNSHFGKGKSPAILGDPTNLHCSPAGQAEFSKWSSKRQGSESYMGIRDSDMFYGYALGSFWLYERDLLTAFRSYLETRENPITWTTRSKGKLKLNFPDAYYRFAINISSGKSFRPVRWDNVSEPYNRLKGHCACNMQKDTVLVADAAARKGISSIYKYDLNGDLPVWVMQGACQSAKRHPQMLKGNLDIIRETEEIFLAAIASEACQGHLRKQNFSVAATVGR